jgi:hypothetical protein
MPIVFKQVLTCDFCKTEIVELIGGVFYFSDLKKQIESANWIIAEECNSVYNAKFACPTCKDKLKK